MCPTFNLVLNCSCITMERDNGGITNSGSATGSSTVPVVGARSQAGTARGRHRPRFSTDKRLLSAHGAELLRATDGLRQASRPYHTYAGSSGPWLENWWIDTFARPVVRAGSGVGEARYATPQEITSDSDGASKLEPYDSELFYPLVPLFIPWSDLQVRFGFVSCSNYFVVVGCEV
jgi:hypothetical protein